MADHETDAALAALVAAARRSGVARRLQGDVETRLLQSIVDATVRLFDAEAASIALFEQDPDRLEFRVAAGEQGAGVVGLTVPPTQGIAGFVYSTGQALALSDVADDPRFEPGRGRADRLRAALDRGRAARRRSRHVGVLQVLDKRGSPTFSLQDMELLGVFAGQATVAIDAARVQRDTDGSCARARRGSSPGSTPAQVETLVRRGDARSRRRRRGALLALVDQVARLRSLSDRETSLLTEILEVVATHADRGAAGAGRRGGDRAASRLVGAVRDPTHDAASQPSDRAASLASGRGRRDGGGVPVGNHRLRPRERPPALGGRVVENVTVELSDDGPTVVPDEAPRHVRPRDRVRRDHPRPRAGGRARLDPRPRRRPARQGNGVRRRSRLGHRAGPRGLQPEPLVEERGALPIFHELADQAYFRGHGARQRGQQRAGPELPVAVLVGLLGRGPRRARPVARSTTTPRRRSSSARGASTCRSRGRTAAAPSRPATASPRPTSPGSSRSSCSKHPGLSPFEVKAILASVADNPGDAAGRATTPVSLARTYVELFRRNPALARLLTVASSSRASATGCTSSRSWSSSTPRANRPSLLGIVGAARILPYVLLSVPAGIVADRFDRRDGPPRHRPGPRRRSCWCWSRP